ncbi:zinc finger protein 696 [Denticeps clupeoides]|uniref:C2H2-type domain-containing protein n=1 Tax=Denticeps clupeoides TaxID=299321 RepID=A0AAY4AFQ8_9TELE|nr:zinc finger protein 696-like [Denticeps clupeoides]
MDKDRVSSSRGPCTWLEMQQFIGDLVASSTSTPGPPVKDFIQQEALRNAWETAGHEALGLKVLPHTHAATSRSTHGKGTPAYGQQHFPQTGEKSGQSRHESQQIQHSGCNCPGCPLSSSSNSPLTLQTLKPREQQAAPHHVRQAKDLNSVPVGLGISLGLGLALEEEASEPTGSSEITQSQHQDKGTNTHSPNHTQTCPPPPMPTFPCLCCHRGFQTCAQLLHHQQGTDIHLAHANQHFHHHCPLTSCLPCPRLRHTAQSPPPFPCLSCQRTFPTCAQLLRHQQGHAQQEGLQQHPCMHCNASFPRPSQLLQHQRTQHASKTGGFMCAECGRAFNSHSNLRIHLNVHTGARPYTCPECGKSFSQSGALKIHRRIHTGERPYTCAYCGRGFPHLAGVRAHQRTHTGEKPYRCSQCGKCFTQSGALKIHMRIHTGERPFVCSLCGKGFSNRSGIRFHHRTVHGIIPDPSLGGGSAGRPSLSLTSSSLAGHASASPTGSLSSNTCSSPSREPQDLSSTSVSVVSSQSSLRVEPDSGQSTGKSLREKGSHSKKQQGGREGKALPYACEDCGLRFPDAPSRNKHQALEHYSTDNREQEDTSLQAKEKGTEQA